MDRRTRQTALQSIAGAWPDYAIVAGAAIVVRLCVSAIWPAAYYFPDSWVFITATMPGWHVYPIDPPTVSYLWRVGTLGFYNERDVLVLQGVLGVISVILVFASLRLIPSKRGARAWALGLALFLAVLPAQLFIERQFMPYATEGFLVALGVWLVMRLLVAGRAVTRVIAFLGASTVLGLAASVWTALMFPALLAWALLVAAWIALSRRHSMGAVLATTSVVAAVICVSLAPSWLANKNQAALGVWSPEPVSGTVLFARFGPLISCHESQSFTPLVAASVRQVCGTHFSIPQKMRAEWTGALNKTMVTRSKFATTQAQLRSLAMNAIADHPTAAVGTVLATLWWELVNSPSSDLISDSNGNRFGVQKNSTFFAGPLLAEHWFLGATTRANQSLAMRTAVSNTRSLARLPLWATVIALVVRLMTWRAERRRTRLRGGVLTRSRVVPLRFWTAVVCGALAIGTMFTISIGAPPEWSYWLPLLPAWLVIFALALPGATVAGLTGECSDAVDLAEPLPEMVAGSR